MYQSIRKYSVLHFILKTESLKKRLLKTVNLFILSKKKMNENSMSKIVDGTSFFPFFFPSTVETALSHPSWQNYQSWILHYSTVIYYNNGILAFADTESFTQSFKLTKKLIKSVTYTPNGQNVQSKSLKKKRTTQ